MAEIRKRGGTYQISVFLGIDDAQKKIRKTTTYTPEATTPKAIEKEVAEFAKNFEKQAKEGELYDGDKMTFSQFLPLWKESILPQKGKKSQQAYLYELENYFVPAFGYMPLSKIRAANIDKVIRQRSKEGKAPRTVKFCFTAISSVMQYAFKKGYIKENPCLRCDDLPKAPAESGDGKELHYFTVPQAKTFLKALTLEYPEERPAKDRKLPDGTVQHISAYTMYHTIPFQYQVYFNIAIFGGFRRGETLALTWDDIDFANHTISIKKSIAASKEGEYIKTPKTRAGVREIVLPSETFKLLREWHKQEIELSMRLGTAWKGYRGADFSKNWIFINLDNGNRMNLDTPLHRFQDTIEMYNKTFAQDEEDKLPIIRLHDLRHTSATLLIANNADIETVCRRLGHSRASITLDIYAHALPEKDVTASQTLEKIFAMA